MADILSLKRARKARKLAERQITAAENSTRYGMTKAQKSAEKAEKALAAKKLDGHKRKD